MTDPGPIARAGEMGARYEQRIRNQLMIISGMEKKIRGILRALPPKDKRTATEQLIAGILSNTVQVDDKGNVIE